MGAGGMPIIIIMLFDGGIMSMGICCMVIGAGVAGCEGGRYAEYGVSGPTEMVPIVSPESDMLLGPAGGGR